MAKANEGLQDLGKPRAPTGVLSYVRLGDVRLDVPAWEHSNLCDWLLKGHGLYKSTRCGSSCVPMGFTEIPVRPMVWLGYGQIRGGGLDGHAPYEDTVLGQRDRVPDPSRGDDMDIQRGTRDDVGCGGDHSTAEVGVTPGPSPVSSSSSDTSDYGGCAFARDCSRAPSSSSTGEAEKDVSVNGSDPPGSGHLAYHMDDLEHCLQDFFYDKQVDEILKMVIDNNMLQFSRCH